MKTSTMRRFGLAAAATLMLGASGLIASPARADTLLIESFSNATVSDASAWTSGGSGTAEGGWPGAACLTAGSDTSQSPIRGCGLGEPDASGAGALRLTPNSLADAGFALYNKALPTTGGLDITFDQAQYGGAADGIAFFLVDGSTDLTQPGSAGGGLGYSAGWDLGSSYGTGVDNGLLGIGIDRWGNFSFAGSTGSGCASGDGPGSAGPGRTPNVVAVRGPGNGSVGYCWLGASADLGSLLEGSTRAESTVQVRIVIDPSSQASPKVTVYLDGSEVLQIDEPQALIDSTKFKFGFSGSTGAVTDVHEVWGLNIDSVVPVPTTSVDPTPSGPTTVAPSMPGDPSGSATAPAAQPVSGDPAYTG